MHPDAGVLLVARVLRNFAYGYLVVVVGIYLDQLGLTPIEVGAVLTASAAGSAALTIGWSLLADRIGRRRSIRVLSLLMVAGGLTFVITSDPLLLALAAFAGSLSVAGTDTGTFVTGRSVDAPAGIRRSPAHLHLRAAEHVRDARRGGRLAGRRRRAAARAHRSSGPRRLPAALRPLRDRRPGELLALPPPVARRRAGAHHRAAERIAARPRRIERPDRPPRRAERHRLAGGRSNGAVDRRVLVLSGVAPRRVDARVALLLDERALRIEHARGRRDRAPDRAVQHDAPDPHAPGGVRRAHAVRAHGVARDGVLARSEHHRIRVLPGTSLVCHGDRPARGAQRGGGIYDGRPQRGWHGDAGARGPRVLAGAARPAVHHLGIDEALLRRALIRPLAKQVTAGGTNPHRGDRGDRRGVGQQVSQHVTVLQDRRLIGQTALTEVADRAHGR